ncbi:MAG TPA: hypothetical protein VFX01_02235 [Methylophilaceae bacterium]|nr:hypothetical protein [Methylophilaceae bacterium]
MSTIAPRPLTAIPPWIAIVLAATLALQIGWQARQPAPVARASALAPLPPLPVLRLAGFGEPIAQAQWLTLYLQAFDNQPGVSIPFKDLDYRRVEQWLGAALALDPRGQYPLLLASRVYAGVSDPKRVRSMLDFVYHQFFADPDRRWRWLAQAAVMARHRLHDMPLALKYADAIEHHAATAPPWARQMRIFLLADMGQYQSAEILLGGLLASGTITDPHEALFLTERLNQLKAKSAKKAPVLPKK